MMKKRILIIFFCITSKLYTQEKQKFVYGATVSIDIGRFNDRIEITPTIHTKLLTNFYLGLGVTLAHYNQKSINYIIHNQSPEVAEHYTTSKTIYYGGSIFTRYFPFENKKKYYRNVYLQAEFEFLQGKGSYRDTIGKYNFDTHNKTLFIGIGYKHLLGNKFAINTNLLFKLNNENNSPYRNPILRIGVEF